MNEINLSEELLLESSIISNREEDLRLHQIGRMVFALSKSSNGNLVFAFASSALCHYLESDEAKDAIRPWLIREGSETGEKITLTLQLKFESGILAMLTQNGTLYLAHRYEIKDSNSCRLQLLSPVTSWRLSQKAHLSRMRLSYRMSQIIEDLSPSKELKTQRLETLWKEYLMHESSMTLAKSKIITGEFMSFTARQCFDGTVVFDSTH